MGPADLYANLERAKTALANYAPRVGMILSTGASPCHSTFEKIACAEIPGFPECFYEDELQLGKIHNIPIALLAGGPQLATCITQSSLAFPVWLFQRLGVEILVLSAGGGALRERITPGSLLVIEDHLNFTGANPLLGVDEQRLGPRFPDLHQLYDRRLAALALKIARRCKIPVHTGIAVCTPGPILETKAEKRFLRKAGADVLINSLVPQAIAGAHAGLRILGITAITDSARQRAKQPLNMETMLLAAQRAAPRLDQLLLELFQEIA